MANVVYNQFMDDLANKKIDLETDLFMVRLCMTQTVAGGDATSASIDDSIRRATSLSVLDGIDGTGTADTIDEFNGTIDGVTYDIDTHDKQITTPTVNQATVEGTNRVNFSGDNVEWLEVDAGSRDIQGALVYWEPGSGTINETTRIPVCFIDFASDIETDGSDIKIKGSGGTSSGNILQMQQG